MVKGCQSILALLKQLRLIQLLLLVIVFLLFFLSLFSIILLSPLDLHLHPPLLPRHSAIPQLALLILALNDAPYPASLLRALQAHPISHTPRIHDELLQIVRPRQFYEILSGEEIASRLLGDALLDAFIPGCQVGIQLLQSPVHLVSLLV